MSKRVEIFDGCENIYAELVAKIENIEAEKQAAIAAAIAEVEQAYIGKAERFQKALEAISDVKEEPDEEEAEVVAEEQLDDQPSEEFANQEVVEG